MTIWYGLCLIIFAEVVDLWEVTLLWWGCLYCCSMSKFVYASEVSYLLDYLKRGTGWSFSCHSRFLSMLNWVVPDYWMVSVRVFFCAHFIGVIFLRCFFRVVYLSLGYLWMGQVSVSLLVYMELTVVWSGWYWGLANMYLDLSECDLLPEEMLLIYLFFFLSAGYL